MMITYLQNLSKQNKETIYHFFKQMKLLPEDYKKLISSILPLIVAQIFQRLYFVIDNHYVAVLGGQALLIHNIQFSFLYIGQYIGAATATSCLIFWKRSEYISRQADVFYIHIVLCLMASVFCMIVVDIFSRQILMHFAVKKEYQLVASVYFKVGLFNMVLQSLYISLLGVIVASGKEKLALTVSGAILTLAIFANSIAVHFYFKGNISALNVSTPLLIIIIANTGLLVLAIAAMLFFIKLPKRNGLFIKLREIIKVWSNELGGGILTSVDPIIYVFQLGLIVTAGSLLVTYQLLMQLSAIFCIFLLATMQISIRDASESFASNRQHTFPSWLRILILFGLIPTEILMLFFLFFPQVLFSFIYGYAIPHDQASYVSIFIFASIIGQIGNALTVPTRAKKNSHFVTFVYFVSDYFVLLAGMQLIIIFHIATPFTAGLVMLFFTIIYTILQGYFAIKSIKK